VHPADTVGVQKIFQVFFSPGFATLAEIPELYAIPFWVSPGMWMRFKFELHRQVRQGHRYLLDPQRERKKPVPCYGTGVKTDRLGARLSERSGYY
jgi:hypothetical protein